MKMLAYVIKFRTIKHFKPTNIYQLFVKRRISKKKFRMKCTNFQFGSKVYYSLNSANASAYYQQDFDLNGSVTMSFDNTDVFILFYCMHEMETFLCLIKFWIPVLVRYAKIKKPSFMLVATSRTSSIMHTRTVSTEQGKFLATLCSATVF